MSEINISIYKVEKSLQGIIPLLRKKYFKPINLLFDGDEEVGSEENSCIYQWKSEGNTGFNIQSISIGGATFQYIEAIASIEVVGIPTTRLEQIGDAVDLEKDMIVDTRTSRVYFVNYLGAVYSIICAPDALSSRIRSWLMETRRKSKSEWGTVHYKNLPQYSFGKNFYYWIIDKKEDDLAKDEDTAKIFDVKGFKSDTERDTSSFSGKGSHIDRRIPLKSIISMGERLVNLFLHMIFNDITYSFVLHNDGKLTLFLSECGVFGTESPRALNLKEAVFIIYFKIIPFLNSKFNEVGIANWDIHEKRIKRAYSMDIITDLMRENSIKLEELALTLSESS